MSEVMRRLIITSLCLVLLALNWQQARGFALLGPFENYPGLNASNSDVFQTTTIGYQGSVNGDIGNPKNVGQGYRRNIPVMYYSYGPSFSGEDGQQGGNFFGLQGQQAVDSAFAILNSAFTNNAVGSLDGYSSNLVEFPFNSQGINYTAESLGLTDVKSEVLFLMMEQLGLAQPERFTWTLHDRFLPSGGTCPIDEEYIVIQRNYYYTPSPLYENLYSPYVNDTLYTYVIEEVCSSPAAPPNAVTVPEAVDPFAQTFTAVAGLGTGLGVTAITATNGIGEPIWTSEAVGGYYTGLTRDDVGGLRYLMSSNTVVLEDPGLGSALESTNFNQTLALTTFPLAPLAAFALTNPPAAVQTFVAANYPGLVVDNNFSNYPVLITNYTVVSYFTNIIGQPSGSPPEFIVATNGFIVTTGTNYVYTYDNMLFFDYSTNTAALLQTTTVGLVVNAPAGTIGTNVSSQKITLNTPSGQFYILPTNSCGFNFISTNVLNQFIGYNTNSTIAIATNTTGVAPNGFVGSETILIPLTNSILFYHPCTLETTNIANNYQGIGKINFIRVDTMDPTTGFFRQPITNTYSMVWYDPTNYRIGGTLTFRRIVTQPDIVFEGADLTSPNPGSPLFGASYGARSTPNFDVGHTVPNLAGPGTINPVTVITFNNVGSVFANGSLAAEFLSTNDTLSQYTQGSLLAYGSFDGTTNQPVVYPNGTSIQQLENAQIISITPTTLPDGTNNVPYPTIPFQASGGQAPYTWSLVGTNFPTGLNFGNGVLSGEPVGNTPGIYDFVIQMMDSANRTVNYNYSITIH